MTFLLRVKMTNEETAQANDRFRAYIKRISTAKMGANRTLGIGVDSSAGGLAGTQRLGSMLNGVLACERDVGEPVMFRRFELGHRRETLPLYQATNVIMRLLTDDRPLARLARAATIRAGVKLPLAKRVISAMLMQRG